MAPLTAAAMPSTSGRVLDATHAGTRSARAPQAPQARRAVVAGAKPRRAEGAGHLFYSRLLRAHHLRLEHLVSSGATSAADLQPVVSELRQIAAEVPVSDGSWQLMRQQLLALESALAAASAPGSEGLGACSTAAPVDGPLDATAAARAERQRQREERQQQRRPRARQEAERVTVCTAAGASLDLAIPDLDCHQPLAPACAPRLAAAGRVSVCTGRKCCQQGALDTLAAARAAAEGSGVEVVAVKCMGKCGKGPCIRTRVEGHEGSSLTKGVLAPAAEALLRQQFGVTC